jgi:hypothetical protein
LNQTGRTCDGSSGAKNSCLLSSIAAMAANPTALLASSRTSPSCIGNTSASARNTREDIHKCREIKAKRSHENPL